jgi:hypothetical protein
MTEDFLHVPSIGDPGRGEAAVATAAELLRDPFARHEIKGYRAYLITDRATEVELLIPEDVGPMVQGTFPYVYLRVNFRDEPKVASASASLRTALTERGFRRIG